MEINTDEGADRTHLDILASSGGELRLHPSEWVRMYESCYARNIDAQFCAVSGTGHLEAEN